MIKLIKRMHKDNKGYMLQIAISILLIGALTYKLLTESYQKPMSTNMGKFNKKLADWTNV